MNFRQRITICLLLYIILGSAALAQNVEIPDPNLRNAIREALNLADGASITQADVRLLTRLEARGEQIQDLSGLQYAINITRIDLGENDISNLSPLAALTQLEYAELRRNPISDLSPLANLPQLHTLFVWECQISDISSLANLTQLMYLDLSFNRIVNILPLANLTRLTELVIRGNEISDVTPLANLTNLEMLWIERNNIVDISPLANLTRLNKLRLNNNEISDVTPLANLTNLETYLHLSHNRIVDIGPLANLMRLIELVISNNEIVDVNPLANLTNLEYLELQNNRISDITPLANLTNLEHLNTENNPIFDPDSPHVDIPDPNLRAAIRKTLNLPAGIPITQAAMRGLKELEAHDKGITDLIGLEFATDLILLDLPRNNISDLSSVTGLTQLEKVVLWVNPISDISPLANLTQLRYLALNGCHIADISPLANLTHLTSLHLHGNPIVDIRPLTNLKQLSNLWINHNEIVDISPLASLTRLTTLRLSNNQIVNIRPLANLTRLTELWINYNEIVDIRPLANLIRLTELHLNDNQLVNIRPLTNLTELESLEIQHNPILDYSSLDGLALTHLSRDEFCEHPPLPVRDRIHNRNYPSIFARWSGLGWPPIVNRPALSDVENLASHDMWFSAGFGLSFLRSSARIDEVKLAGNLDEAIRQRNEFLALNPNMIFLIQIEFHAVQRNEYPDDWPYWIRDAQGKIVERRGSRPYGLIDFTHPDIQDRIVAEAVAVSKCGLYDGIMIDWWNDHAAVLVSEDPPIEYRGYEVETQAKINIMERIRAETGQDFLILGNVNRDKLPRTGQYVNGGFMETVLPYFHSPGWVENTLRHIEDSLLWLEQNLREPQINGLEGWAIPTEPPDSPTNLRWMRAITTLSLTHSDGYVVFTGTGVPNNYHHYWFDFWDADLGRPLGAKATLYDEEIPGLYIREYTNGWAVYNHSGEMQEITLPELVTGVASGAESTTHSLPNYDGEMYLKAKPKNPADVNGDGVVNILDLTLVAQAFGKDGLDADVNGDGVVNVFDLVFVANQF